MFCAIDSPGGGLQHGLKFEFFSSIHLDTKVLEFFHLSII